MYWVILLCPSKSSKRLMLSIFLEQGRLTNQNRVDVMTSILDSEKGNYTDNTFKTQWVTLSFIQRKCSTILLVSHSCFP